MLFNSFNFIIFLSIVLLLYYNMKSKEQQNYMMIIASFVFYAFGGLKLIFLLFSYIAINFFCGMAIEDNRRDKSFQKTILVLAIFSNLVILCYFKYLNFMVGNFEMMLSFFGFKVHEITLRIALPIGISFYTFQCISYVVDIYRGNIKASRDFIVFGLYISYFPQLVAGPIERASHMLPQFSNARTVTRDDILIGVGWILVGFFFKVVVADKVAPLVDAHFIYPFPFERSGATDALAVLGFGLQIYGDFAGYSLIARGTARLMGIRIMRNFNGPYIANSIRDFWHRWHISLSTWLRDYLYIPLGGSRGGKPRTYRNLLLTMGLGGFWHGASWNFFLWGVYHGVLLSIDRMIGGTRETKALGPVRVLATVTTFLLVMIGWLLFRVDSMEQFFAISSNIIFNFFVDYEAMNYAIFIVTLYAVVLIHSIVEEKYGDEEWIRSCHWALRTSIFAAMAACVVTVGFSPIQFIYFRF